MRYENEISDSRLGVGGKEMRFIVAAEGIMGMKFVMGLEAKRWFLVCW